MPPYIASPGLPKWGGAARTRKISPPICEDLGGQINRQGLRGQITGANRGYI